MGDVLLERHDGVLLVTINRPERNNAIGGTLIRDLSAAFVEAQQDDAVKVVVTTATGKAFSVGADAAAFEAGEPVPARELLGNPGSLSGEMGLEHRSPGLVSMDDLGNAGRLTSKLWSLEKPTIAAVNGVAVGGGLCLALLHDLVIAGQSARFGTGFGAIGLAPEMGISWVLPRVVGFARAAELLYTGRLVGSAEAKEIGLAIDVVDDTTLRDKALELASVIAANQTIAMQYAKRLLRSSATNTMDAQLRAEYASHLVLFDHPDTRAAFSALVGRLKAQKGNGR